MWGWLADWMQQAVRVAVGDLAFDRGADWCGAFEPKWVWLGMLLFSIGWAPVALLSDAMTLEGIRQQKQQQDRSTYEYGSIRQWGSIGYMVGVIIVGWAVGWGIRGGTLVTVLLGPYVFTIPAVQINLPRPKWSAVRTLLKNKMLIWILFCAGLHFFRTSWKFELHYEDAGEIGVSIRWTSDGDCTWCYR